MPLRQARNHGLLRQHSLIRTDRSDRMRDVLFDTYKARRFEVRRDRGDFFGQASRLRLSRIGLDYCAYGAEVELEFPEVGGYRQQICLSGGGETIVGAKHGPLSMDDSCIIPSGAKVETHLGAGYRQLVLWMDSAALQRKLEAITGDHVGPLEFRFAANLRSAQHRNLKRLALFLAGELDSPDSQFSPLALVEFEQALIVSFLCANQHSFSHLLEKPPSNAAPWQVRQAEAYVEANWDKPLSIAAISEAVGVSVRSIFNAFKQNRGYSPMTFLKQTRLRKAREMLSLGQGDESVTRVAFACGFQSHGHFAREYKLQFGEAPSQTLASMRAK